MSGETDSGSGVITLDIAVSFKGSSLAIARVIISLKPKIPTSSPSSTTRAAFRRSAIISPASLKLVSGLTMVAGLPAKILRKVGDC